MRGFYKIIAPLLLLVATSTLGWAQDSPEEYLGYELGSKFTLTQHLEEYYQHLAANSPRVEYKSYGKSVLGRDLPLLFIGSEENIKNKEEIREQIKTITKRTTPLPDDELETLSSETPSTMYIYLLDAANEFPGIEGSMQIAYDLATKEDAETQQMRDELLVVMSPMPNPDAHAKTVEWLEIYNIPGSSVDPNAKQNRSYWGVRSDGNVWGIDLNRDFTWFVTPETRAMAEVSVKWQPQTMLDLHCCPPIFFMTPTGPPDHPMWPRENRKWGDRSLEIAKKEFGKRGFTMSSGMDYAGITYLGHGITWGLLGPSVTGQMFESIGGKPDLLRSDGSIATLEMGIERHIVGTRAVMKNLSKNKQELLKDAHTLSVRSAEEARQATVRGAVIPADESTDATKLHRLLDRLSLQGIEINKATESFSVEGRHFMRTDSKSEVEFPAGSYFIDFDQPFSRLARSILDPTQQTLTPLVDPRSSRSSPFYDSQVQNLPLLFGVNAYTVEGGFPSIQHEKFENEKLSHTLVESGAAQPYGYVLPAGKESSYKVAVKLMQEDYKGRVFKGPFILNDNQYKKGSFAFIGSRNKDGLHNRITELAEKHHATLIEVSSPINQAGVDFGNTDLVEHIPNPEIAVLADSPARYGDMFAGIRTALEIDFNVTFTPVRKSILEKENLSKYTVIVLPEGNGYEEDLDLENIKSYVRNGGTVIAAKNAGAALSQDSFLGENITEEDRADQTYGTILRAEWITYDSPTPGKWVRWEPDLKVDRPLLSVGFDKEFAARGANVILYEIKEDSDAEALARFGNDPATLLLDGFMLEDDKEKIAGKPYVVHHPAGQGRVIYLTEPINYRGYWYGTNLIFLNSLLFGPTL